IPSWAIRIALIVFISAIVKGVGRCGGSREKFSKFRGSEDHERRIADLEDSHRQLAMRIFEVRDPALVILTPAELAEFLAAATAAPHTLHDGGDEHDQRDADRPGGNDEVHQDLRSASFFLASIRSAKSRRSSNSATRRSRPAVSPLPIWRCACSTSTSRCSSSAWFRRREKGPIPSPPPRKTFLATPRMTIAMTKPNSQPGNPKFISVSAARAAPPRSDGREDARRNRGALRARRRGADPARARPPWPRAARTAPWLRRADACASSPIPRPGSERPRHQRTPHR